MRNLIDSRSLFRTCRMCFKSREVNNIKLQQTTFSNACIKLLIYQSKNSINCTVVTILNCLCIDVCCQMGTACACEVYETSSNLSFACFSRESETFNSRFTQIPTSLEFGKIGIWRGRVEKTLENALIQASKFWHPIRQSFRENCRFLKIFENAPH